MTQSFFVSLNGGSRFMSYNAFIFSQFWEFFLGDVGVGQEDFDDGFGEAFHVALPNFRVGTFEFGDDVETLRKLRENIDDRRREQGVFTAALELEIKNVTKN